MRMGCVGLVRISPLQTGKSMLIPIVEFIKVELHDSSMVDGLARLAMQIQIKDVTVMYSKCIVLCNQGSNLTSRARLQLP